MTRRILGLLGSAAIVAGAAAASASADGLPVLGVDVGSKGVTVPGAAARYVTLWSGPKTTVVARVRRNGGRELLRAHLNERSAPIDQLVEACNQPVRRQRQFHFHQHHHSGHAAEILSVVVTVSR